MQNQDQFKVHSNVHLFQCLQMLFQVEIPMLLVNAQDDPLVPEELLDTPKKYANSMSKCCTI
jgi:predicted alpha/beta-fold hydrolase